MTVSSLRLETAFFKEWLQSPLRVGALAPSGARLAAAITQEISSDTGPILELGPGTGVFTKLLLERGVKPNDIAAIEFGSRFADTLRRKYPSIQVIEGDAVQIERLSPFPAGTVGKVVCGLPLLSMSAETVERIVLGSIKQLHADGSFRLFTYGPSCPIPRTLLKRTGLSSSRISRTLLNMPPASVYELRREIQR